MANDSFEIRGGVFLFSRQKIAAKNLKKKNFLQKCLARFCDVAELS